MHSSHDKRKKTLVYENVLKKMVRMSVLLVITWWAIRKLHLYMVQFSLNSHMRILSRYLYWIVLKYVIIFFAIIRDAYTTLISCNYWCKWIALKYAGIVQHGMYFLHHGIDGMHFLSWQQHGSSHFHLGVVVLYFDLNINHLMDALIICPLHLLTHSQCAILMIKTLTKWAHLIPCKIIMVTKMYCTLFTTVFVIVSNNISHSNMSGWIEINNFNDICPNKSIGLW